MIQRQPAEGSFLLVDIVNSFTKHKAEEKRGEAVTHIVEKITPCIENAGGPISYEKLSNIP
jgi:hypothetical protein